jgi:phosphodiesterase/alkaline phosphatase D-like protein
MKSIKKAVFVLFMFFAQTISMSAFGASEPNIVLGRPTDQSVAMSIFSDSNMEAYIEYGSVSGNYANQTTALNIQANIPIEFLVDNLQTDSRYYYRIRWRPTGASDFTAGEEHFFHTQRQPGKEFIFTIQADPHYGESTFNAEVYKIALQNALKDNPDFHIDLGDTFMTEKYFRDSYEQVLQAPLAHRPYFGMIAHSAPLFLVNGNHEGELGWELKDNENNLAVWSVKARQLCYPCPVPGDFYSGSSTTENYIGIRDSYYSYEWGNALFVVLDPFWYTNPKPGGNTDNWGWTLGEAQYRWFKQTIEQSQAKFKFVFIHHLTSGTGPEARGGIEVAQYYEWGGLNADNTDGFESHRPGWGKPIHQLMVEKNVSILFHGHDHVFVKQELDGVVYQECPQPSNREYDKANLAEEGGYINGDIVNGSGHIRVTVSESTVKAEYIQAVLPEDENKERVNGQVAYTYNIGGDSEKGDIDGNGYTDLKDAILCLRILAGMNLSSIIREEADVNGDGKIGLAELIYILYTVSGEPTTSSTAFNGSIIPGRATDKSILMNIVAQENTEAFIEYGKEEGVYENKTENLTLAAGVPTTVGIGNLEASSRYFYRIRYKTPSESEFSAGEDYSFSTQKSAGEAFVFTIVADSHLGTVHHCDPTLYEQTMKNLALDKPDLHFDLGDTFRSSKVTDPDYQKIENLYIAQRPFFNYASKSAPTYLVIGNHELEYGWLLDGTENTIPIWSTKARKLYYPNPEPDDFYTGNIQEYDFIGKRQNYYAFTWGDALFVALDPYWTTMSDPHGDTKIFWDSTIGDEQYLWFKETLEKSAAKYKFVFMHHIHGESRGGTDVANSGEWGDSANLKTYRPNWEKTIHQLMVDNRVSIFFQGHDHIFVRQELDGIVYQTCPMPGDPYYSLYNADAFLTGDKLPNSGHVRATVSSYGIKVDYIRAFLPEDEKDGHVNGEVAFSYTVPTKRR